MRNFPIMVNDKPLDISNNLWNHIILYFQTVDSPAEITTSADRYHSQLLLATKLSLFGSMIVKNS